MKNLNTPNVAVLMPSYNGSKFIDKQILTILNQNKVSLTLYIFDDDSEDDTFSKISKFNSVKLKKIRSLPEMPGKKSAAKSFFRIILGIELESNYDFVAFADQDDIWFSNKLSKALNFLKNKKYSGYSSSILAFWKDGRTKLLQKSGFVSKFNSLFESAGPGCTYVINRETFDLFRAFLIKNKNRFNNVDFHDWTIYAFAVNNGLNWFIDSSPGMLYRQHDNNSFGARYSFEQYFKRLKLIMNGWYFSQVYINHKLYFSNSIILKFPNFMILHRIYFFIMVLIYRRKFLDKISLSLLSLVSKLKIDE